MSSSQARENFGELLDTSQREAVLIEKKGRPVSVVLSKHEYDEYQLLKEDWLRKEIQKGIDAYEAGDFEDGPTVMKRMLERARRRIEEAEQSHV